jgi:hypothetical protein
MTKDRLIEGFRLTLKYTFMIVFFPIWGPMIAWFWFFGDCYTEGSLLKLINWISN